MPKAFVESYRIVKPHSAFTRLHFVDYNRRLVNAWAEAFKEFIQSERMARCNMKNLLPIGLAVGAMIVATAHAQEVVMPVSYVSTPGEGRPLGSYDYFDDTGSQLTDGVIGTDNVTADLGNGPAYEWVAWKTVEPTITFTFSETVLLITSVQLGLARAEGANRIHLPSTVAVGGTVFAPSGVEIANDARGFLTFFGSWSGTNIAIQLSDNDPTWWVFLDEVRFIGQAVRLKIERSGPDVVLSWPVAATNFVLEATSDLPGTNAWESVTNTPSIVGQEYRLTSAASGNAKFYRLRHP
jgi:hypothetical protein